MPGRVIIAKELSEIFKLLAHPDRIRLIEELGSEEKTVSQLADDTNLPSTRVSQHLSLLRAHRIVDERPDGRHRLYHLTQPELAAWIVSGLDFIEGRVQAPDAKEIKRVKKQWGAKA
ncbi:MAG: metalloregulator ArsR/SmtB family transcription factor [Pseudomonadota bacterium]